MIGFFIIYFIEELVDYYWVRKSLNTKDESSEDIDGKIACLDLNQPPKTYER